MTKTSLGPNGMKKMVINHIDKIFVTSDAATIMRELEVQHPAAKMVVMASKMQESECGDGTNLVITLAGELLYQAESLIRMGLHPSQIIEGYEAAQKKACELLEQAISFRVSDPTKQDEVIKALRSSVGSKLQDYTDFIGKLVAESCITVLPTDHTKFDLEYVRVAKILGGSVFDSFVMHGLVITRNAEGSITKMTNPKIAVYGAALDPQQGDTKGTILIKNATELKNYTKSEEELAEKLVKQIAEAGVNCIVVGGSIAELVLHYVEKYRMMIIKVTSKFELRRLCKALGASPISSFSAPTPDELGFCDSVEVQEIGSQKVTVFKKNAEECKLSTIVLRGSTNNLLDDIERAIDNGVNCYRCLLKDPAFLPGAGATEIYLAAKLEQEANQLKGLDQYSYNRFAKSFEVIPRILIENAGLNANEMISKLHTASLTEPHGIDIEKGELVPSKNLGVYDHMRTKWWAIKLASDTAVTILRVDQIIISKPAGGPKPQQQGGNWDDTD